MLKRLAQSALTIFLTLTTVFVLIRMAPGDPAYALAGPLASTKDLAQIRADMGLTSRCSPIPDLPVGPRPPESRHVVLVPGAGHGRCPRPSPVHHHPCRQLHSVDRRALDSAGRVDGPSRGHQT
ncbi:hypothetical protein ACETU7_26315 [Rhodococcus sp. 3Y1]